MSDKIEIEEEPKSNYYNWLLKFQPVEKHEEKKQEDEKLLISAFSEFLSKRNPDYHYNESYLTSYFDEFIYVSENLYTRHCFLKEIITSKLFKEACTKISSKVNYFINIGDSIICKKTFNDNMPKIMFSDNLSNIEKEYNKCTISFNFTTNGSTNNLEFLKVYKNVEMRSDKEFIEHYLKKLNSYIDNKLNFQK